MSVKVANSRLIISSLKHAALYQQIFRNLSDFQKLGNRVIQSAEQAQMLRQIERMEECGLILSNIPIKEYGLIGQYYLGWGAHLKGQGAKHIFENVLEESRTYKSRALIALAAIEDIQGNHSQQSRCFTEALRLTDNPSIILDTYRGIAIMKARDGFNKQSLADLENLLPLAQYANNKTYYTYLNSLAVELGEAGRIEEAQNGCKITLASPYAFAYPEWREREQDLAIRGYKSRSSIPVIRKIPVVRKVRENVLYMSERERSEGHRLSPFYQPRDVSTIADWKEKKMGKEPNGNGEEKEELSDKQMVMKIMEYATDDDMPDEALHEMLEAIKKISRSYKSKKGKT